jgi:SPP1 gp7 family putative phage head morphogenesis protein|tara:strand:+ start:3287 stop:4234 length:948 start_codon:yes stop_codon:yes gene_type:complete
MGVRKELDLLLKDSEKAVLDVMQSNLAFIGDSLINKVVAKESGLSNAKKLDAIKGVDASGLNEYKDDLLDVLTIIAYETLRQRKKEVPKAKYELSEKDIYSIQFVESKTVKKATKKVKKTNKRIETMWKKLPAKVRRRIKTQQELLVKTQLADLEKAIYFQYTTSTAQEKAINQVKKDMQDNAEDFIEGPSVRAGAPLTAHQTISEASSAFFTDPEVDKEIEAFEFVNNYTQDRTPICEELNGTIFAKDDPNLMKFTPPLHWNCRSLILPILVGDLKGRKIEKLKIKKSNEKYLQFSEKLESFILAHQMSDQGIL